MHKPNVLGLMLVFSTACVMIISGIALIKQNPLINGGDILGVFLLVSAVALVIQVIKVDRLRNKRSTQVPDTTDVRVLSELFDQETHAHAAHHRRAKLPEGYKKP